MKDYKLLFVLGLIVLLVPFFGIPELYKNWITSIVSLFLIGFSIYIRSQVKKELDSKEDVFVESSNSFNDEIKEEVFEEGEQFENRLMEEDDE